MANRHSSAPRRYSEADYLGRTFGRLTVIERTDNQCGRVRFLCRCVCGKVKAVLACHLKSGHSTSCGCFQRERRTTHGRTKTPEHRAWERMIRRCSKPACAGYADYGGRGITVCNRWQGRQGFANFLADMGPRPSPRHSIDRIDNDGSYEPGNVRWATAKEQMRNRRNCHYLTWQGRTLTLTEVAESAGIHPRTLFGRLKLGWPLGRALTEPIHPTGFPRHQGRSE